MTLLPVLPPLYAALCRVEPCQELREAADRVNDGPARLGCTRRGQDVEPAVGRRRCRQQGFRHGVCQSLQTAWLHLVRGAGQLWLNLSHKPRHWRSLSFFLSFLGCKKVQSKGAPARKEGLSTITQHAHKAPATRPRSLRPGAKQTPRRWAGLWPCGREKARVCRSASPGVWGQGRGTQGQAVDRGRAMSTLYPLGR